MTLILILLASLACLFLLVGLVDTGFGSTITFQSSLIGQIRNITVDGWERPVINTSHMATANNHDTFIPGDLANPGQITVEMLFDVNSNWKTAMTAAAETVTLTLPIQSGHSSAATFACSGFLVSVSKVIPFDDVMTCTAVIQLTGPPTETDGA